MKRKSKLTAAERSELFDVLRQRFERHMERHGGMEWSDVRARLEVAAARLGSLWEMEQTGGEPDVVGRDEGTGSFVFVDCSAESPAGRRGLCYDREGLESRKEHRPADTAVDMAASMGVELLTESQYRELQELGSFDRKTSSWLMTPAEVQIGRAHV